MNVDEMTVGQLRVAIAERLGWSAGPATQWPRKVTPGDGAPNWPADIADADALLDDLDRRGAHYELASLAGTGYQLTIVMDGPDGEIWLIYGIGPTRSEAICRAWLKATEPAE